MLSIYQACLFSFRTFQHINVLLLINRGVLSIAWSLADPELLLSCGKDSRMLCWNPNTAEVKVV